MDRWIVGVRGKQLMTKAFRVLGPPRAEFGQSDRQRRASIRRPCHGSRHPARPTDFASRPGFSAYQFEALNSTPHNRAPPLGRDAPDRVKTQRQIASCPVWTGTPHLTELGLEETPEES